MNSIASKQVDQFIHQGLPPLELMPSFVFETNPLPDELNAVTYLENCRWQAGDQHRVFLRSDTQQLTYQQVAEIVSKIARVLLIDYRLVPGNRVLLRGANTIGLALSWLAVVKAGLIAVPTMPLLRARELSTIVAKAKPSLALCDFSLREELLACGGVECVYFGASDHPQDLGILAGKYSNVDLGDEDQSSCKTLASDIAMMAFTSGTTGAPKAAVHTHRDLIAACEAWPKHVLQAKPDDIVLGTPPLAFTFGLGGLLLFPMWAGCSVYFSSQPYTPPTLLEAIQKQSVTICYTAPTMYRQLARLMQSQVCPSLRECVSAGEALPSSTRSAFKQASGIDLLDGIGATEMFHIFVSSRAHDTVPGAIGKVVPGYQAKIVDEHGHELPLGTVGRLAVRGPTGCKYFDDARQANYVRDGWNYPGDAFSCDEHGNYFYHSRMDDMIVSAGYNIAATDVEEILLGHPSVLECAVVGDADEERGMLVHAHVVLKTGELGDTLMVERLQTYAKQQAAPYKYPRRISFHTSLPRTETGKLQRFKLKIT